MESDSISTGILLAVLLLFSAYFSATETAFSSLNRIRIKNMAENGDKRAALVLKLSEDYDRLLSTILVGNNIVNLAAASIATVLFVRLYGDIGATVSTIAMTVLVLVFGEISPKSLAKEHPETFAMFSAPILRVLMVLLTPVNALFSQWKKLLRKLFRAKGEGQSITEEELLTLVEEAEAEGAINEDDRDLILNVIEFNDRTATEIFTPRVDVTAVELHASKKKIAEAFSDTGFSRLPVYEGSVDNITGVIHLKDFYSHCYEKRDTIETIMKAVVFVPPNMKISLLLKLLQKTKSHLAVITDEYGGTAGIVTMEDILEELVGEIYDEHDEVVEQFVKLDENKYKISCGADLEDMYDYFNISGEMESSTVSGWIMDQLDKIPEEGDAFEYEDLFVQVCKTDHRRALEILVEKRASCST